MNPDRTVSGRLPTVPPFGDSNADSSAPAGVLARLPPFATRMSTMPASAVREILKVAERPDILSFAGGLPAPELFPVDAIAAAMAEALSTNGPAALQYST